MIRHTAALLSVAVLAQGCAYMSQRDGDQLKNDVYALQTQVTALQQALSQLQEIEKQEKEQLGTMTQELGELSKAARRNDADLGVQIDEMMQTVGRLKGTVESFNERVTGLEANTSKVQEELKLRFAGLDEKHRIDAATSDEDKKRAVEEAKTRERLLGDPSAVFVEVKKLLAAERAADARKLIRELNLRHENDKGFDKRRDESQYYLGETYYAEGNFQQAAAEYNTVRKNYPKSELLPNALYRLGQCFEKLNLPEDARLFYQTVVQKYAKSDVAKDAKTRLKDLK